MAGKPEAPQHHVQHQPSVQNVVVYLSNDNLAYATAVDQQNVATSYHQQTQQNGGTAVSFANAPQSVASIAPPKSIGKFQVKTQDFSSNGFVGRHNNVSLQQHTGFYAANTTGISQSNGFHNCHSPNVIGNLVYNNSGVLHPGGILNQSLSAASLKNLVNLGSQSVGQQSTACPSNVEPPGGNLCNGTQQTQPRIAVSCTQGYLSGLDHKTSAESGNVSAQLPVNTFVGGQAGEGGNFVAVMGGETNGGVGGTVVLPRCDSVRSEAAESSCSSLSSADSQPDASVSNSLALLLPPSGSQMVQGNQHNILAGNNIPHNVSVPGVINNSGMVMVNSGVNVQQLSSQAGLVRTPGGAIPLSQQQLGNIVLAMAVPSSESQHAVTPAPVNSSQTDSPTNGPTPAQSIAVPLGWKRITVNGTVVYFSPSNTALRSLDHVKEYLQTPGTCKCGLECPLNTETVFNFDYKVCGRPWAVNPDCPELTKLCNHKRKLLIMASLQQHGSKDGRSGRPKKRKLGPGVTYTASISALHKDKSVGALPQGKDTKPTQVWSQGGVPTPPQQGCVPIKPPQYSSMGYPEPQYIRYQQQEGNTNPSTQQTGPGFVVNNMSMMQQQQQQLLHQNQQQQHIMYQQQDMHNMLRLQQQQQHFYASQQQQQQNSYQSGEHGKVCMQQPHLRPQFNSYDMYNASRAMGVQQHGMMQQTNNPTLVMNHQTNSPSIVMNQQTNSPGMAMNQQTNSPGIVMNQQTNSPGMAMNQQTNSPSMVMNQQTHSPGIVMNQQTNSPGMVMNQQTNNLPMVMNQSTTGNPTLVMNQQTTNPNMLMNQQNSNLTMIMNQQPTNPSMLMNQQANVIMNQQISNQSIAMNQQAINSPMAMSQQTNNSTTVMGQQQANNSTSVMNQQANNSTLVMNQQANNSTMVMNQQANNSALVMNQQANNSAMVMNHQQATNSTIVMNQQANNSAMVMNQQANNSAMVMNQQTNNSAMVMNQQHASNSTMVMNQQHASNSAMVMNQQQASNSAMVMNQQANNSAMVMNQQSNNSTMVMNQQRAPPWQQNRGNGVMVPMMQHSPMVIPSAPQQISSTYERVPPLHPYHSTPVPGWTEDNTRKKTKAGKQSNTTKKHRTYGGASEAHNHSQQHRNTQQQDPQTPCPNIDVRQLPVEHNRPPAQQSSSSGAAHYPSFMEDPSGYLAQQTALLNSTISRQTGVGSQGYLCHSPTNVRNPDPPPPVVTSCPPPVGVPLPSNVLHQATKGPSSYNPRSNSSAGGGGNASLQNQIQPLLQNANVSLSNPTPTSTYKPVTSSPVFHMQAADSSLPQDHCQGCVNTVVTTMSGENVMYHHHHQHQQQLHSIQTEQSRLHQNDTDYKTFQPAPAQICCTTGFRESIGAGYMVQQQDDNPVTSSTFTDRSASHQHGAVVSHSDSRGPIQGETVSTSNGSPVEAYSNGSIIHQHEASPTSSSSSSTPMTSMHSSTSTCRALDAVASSGSSAVISSSSSSPSPFVVPHVSPSGLYSYPVQTTFQQQQHAVVCSSPGMTTASTTLHRHNPRDNYCSHVQEQGRTLKFPAIVTTMASGHTVSSNTLTSVLAGKANTATVSAAPVSTSPPSSAPQPTTYSAQPIHVAVSKSPLEMVQSVVSSIQVPIGTNNTTQQHIKHPPVSSGLPPGHILVSSGGQLIMTNAGPALMAPPGPVSKHSTPMMTSVTAAMTQVIPAVGVAQQVPTVLVNALPAPLLIQPGVMTMDGMTGLNQNTMQIPHLTVTAGNMIHSQHGSGQLIDPMGQDPNQRVSHNSGGGFLQQRPSPPEIAPGTKKKATKKRKVSQQTVASMLHIASQQQQQQNNSSLMMQQPQQQSFTPQQGFTMSSPHQGITTTGPMLQALTIVPGKPGAPAQILMNGQPGTATGHFGAHQLITTPTSQQPQQINLLQPVNLLNSATGVVQNFPAFQQFIVPGLGGMVMATDGTTTILPDTSNIGVQLQLQNVNGQNVLTPVQSHSGTVFGHHAGQSILAAGPAGMVIRAPASGGKMPPGTMIQQQNAGPPQFLAATSPTGHQFLMNSPAAFGGQLSPLVANVSPNHQMSFTTNSPNIRPATSSHHHQQDFIQCGQMGQTLMVPCSVPATTAQNTTVVQQNTTIVQQHTTMVSNNQQLLAPQQSYQPNANSGGNATTLNIGPQNFFISNNNGGLEKANQQATNMRQLPPMMKHSVSTQTAAGSQTVQMSSSPGITPGALMVSTNTTFCQTSTGSPPDTTTHSPVDPNVADGRAQSPAADTTTHSIGLDDALPSTCHVSNSCSDHQGCQQASMPMVHCVSSSNEPESQGESDWSTRRLAEGGMNPGHADPIGRKSGGFVESTTLVPAINMSYIGEVFCKQSGGKIIGSSRRLGNTPTKKRHGDTAHSLEEEDDEERDHQQRLSPGDLVWGSARGYPAWPGKLVGPVLGSPGLVSVRWFGGGGESQVAARLLKTLSEGLEAHHTARTRGRKSRKLNSQLEKAIQEAMGELDRMTEPQEPVHRLRRNIHR